MSAHIESHDHHDDHGHGEEEVSHSTLKGYMMGFFLAVVLTAIPFWLVMGKVIPNPQTLAIVILTFAAIQIVVHMIYFLHMDTKSQGVHRSPLPADIGRMPWFALGHHGHAHPTHTARPTSAFAGARAVAPLRRGWNTRHRA